MKLSQEQLASKAGLSRNTISSLENGEFTASIETLFKVADALAMTPEVLVEKTRKHWQAVHNQTF